MRRVSTIAHRGFSAAAPENTLAAFRRALEPGPDMIECDVRRSKDGRVVVIHDSTVDRTTNGKGRVLDLTLGEIRELDAGAWFGTEFAGERVPTLEEVLDLPLGGTKLIIEVKDEGLEDDVVALVDDRRMAESVLIASFYYSIGTRLFELAPRVPFVALTSVNHLVLDEEAVRLADEAAAVNASILGMNYTAVTSYLSGATHSANLQLMAWTVDKESDIREMVDAGADMIASDDIALLLQVLREVRVKSS